MPGSFGASYQGKGNPRTSVPPTPMVRVGGVHAKAGHPGGRVGNQRWESTSEYPGNGHVVDRAPAATSWSRTHTVRIDGLACV